MHALWIGRVFDSQYAACDGYHDLAQFVPRVCCKRWCVASGGACTGSAGCGKTSLVSYLANAAGYQLHVLYGHAGTTSADIAHSVLHAERLSATSNEASRLATFHID